MNQSISQESTELKILSAARKVFIKKGFNGARMQEIADCAGVNKALLHYYFRSKQKLYESVLVDILNRVWSSVRESKPIVTKNTEIRQLIQTIVATYIMIMKENPDFVQMILREFADGGKFLKTVIEHLLTAFADTAQFIFNVLQGGIRAQRIKQINPVQIITSMIGMTMATFIAKPLIDAVYTTVLHQHFADDDNFYKERIDVITEILCNGILNNG